MGKPILKAILDGAQEVATPAFVSTLSISIVFVSVMFLTGAAKSLFTPLAMAVVFAMLPSYLLSRTLVPTLVRYLLPSEAALYRARAGQQEGGGGENNQPNPAVDQQEGGDGENNRPIPTAAAAPVNLQDALAEAFINRPELNRLRRPLPRHTALTNPYPRGSVVCSGVFRAVKESGGD